MPTERPLWRRLGDWLFGRPRHHWATVLAIVMVFNLFYLGRKPFAVGLFPEPYDKLAHLTAFGSMTVLLWLGALRNYPMLLLGMVALVGFGDEWHQRYLPGRSSDVSDWMMDLLGAAWAIAVMHYLRLLYWAAARRS